MSKDIVGISDIKRIANQKGVDIELKNINSNRIRLEDYAKIIGKDTLKNLALEAIFSTKYFEFEDGKLLIGANVSIDKIAGHVFEALLVGIMRTNIETGESLLNWCTGHGINEFGGDFGSLSFFSFYYSLKIIAKAAKETKDWDGTKYCTTSKNDVEFYIRNPRKSEASICIGGFQVKAIQGNEASEIIYPLLHKEYDYVITLLENMDEHSYKRCERELERMVKKKKIDNELAHDIYSRIGKPEMFGISQDYINYVYKRLFLLKKKGKKFDKLQQREPAILEGLKSFALSKGEQDVYLITEPNKNIIINKRIREERRKLVNMWLKNELGEYTFEH